MARYPMIPEALEPFRDLLMVQDVEQWKTREHEAAKVERRIKAAKARVVELEQQRDNLNEAADTHLAEIEARKPEPSA